MTTDRAPLQVSSAGLTPATCDPAARPQPPWPRPTPASPSTTGAIQPMPKSYADLLREARAQISEVTPQEVDALPPERARPSSTSARRPNGSRATSRARSTSARATSSSRSRPPSPDRDAPVILYCAGGVRSLFAAQTLAEHGLHRRRDHVRRLPGVEGRGPAVRDAGRPDDGAEAALQPPPADPGGRLGRPGEAARVEGAAHRRRRARQPGGAVPRRRRRRHDRHRRLRRRRPQQPPAPDHPHDRPGRRAQGRVGPRGDQRPQPGRQGRHPRGDARRRQRRPDHRRLRRDHRRDRHVRDPLPAQRRGRRARTSRSSTPASSGSRAS